MKKKMNLIRKRWTLLTFFLLVCSCTLTAQRIAIIDAGSSGSRLYVYELITEGTPRIQLVFPTNPEQKKASLGKALSSVANHPDSVRVFLENMTSGYRGNHTQLYILATAGMRLKPEAQTEAMYQQLCELDTINGYVVEGAMTISGQYEGLYGWLAANYDHGNIKVKEESSKTILSYNDYPHGILEIGGASMQLAFSIQAKADDSKATTNNTKATADETKAITNATKTKAKDCLYRPGLNYIYSKSYLGGGVDQIFKNTAKKKKGYHFQLELEDVSSLYPSNTWFMGLGIPVNYVLKGIDMQDGKSYPKKVNAYIHSLDSIQDNEANYHPRITGHYVKWVSENFRLDEKLIQPITDSSWTLGAALDFLIYHERPQKYNRQLKN